MRILDENNNELSPSEIDGEAGYLEVEKLLIQHHPPIEEIKEISHYAVNAFKFTDGSSLIVDSEQDPHIKIIDSSLGKFEYISLPGEPIKELQSIDLKTIIDRKGQQGVEAWDEYEYIQRYKLFTDSQLASKKRREEEQQQVDLFLKQGPKLIQDLQKRIEQLENIVGTIQKGE